VVQQVVARDTFVTPYAESQRRGLLRATRIVSPLLVILLTLTFISVRLAEQKSTNVESETSSTGVVPERPVSTNAFNVTSSKIVESLNKSQVPCPNQATRLGVLLVIGQSNSANFAEKRLTTRYPNQVLNYFDGKCYVASSPLLGASGSEGEFITPLADTLIESKIYDEIVIISLGVGGSKVEAWSAGGDLNRMMFHVLDQARGFQITEVIWHQGEADFTNRTSSESYIRSFHSLSRTLADHGVTAPIFIAIATKCGYDEIWVKQNDIAVAQRSLIDNETVFLGADTDDLLAPNDRRLDECHLSASGQLKVAASFASAITTLVSRGNDSP